MAVCVTEKANGAYRLTAHLPSNWELAGVATAAIPLPTNADSTKPAAPPKIAMAIPPPVEKRTIGLLRMAPWWIMRSHPMRVDRSARLWLSN
jgi:hypothetical protein